MNLDVDALFKMVEILLLPAGWYIIKRLDAVVESTKELKTILIGADGKNGMRSRVIRLEKKVSNLSLLQAARHGEASPLLEEADADD